jgi:hypothetical protein
MKKNKLLIIKCIIYTLFVLLFGVGMFKIVIISCPDWSIYRQVFSAIGLTCHLGWILPIVYFISRK